MTNYPATPEKDAAFAMQTEYLYRKKDYRQIDVRENT